MSKKIAIVAHMNSHIKHFHVPTIDMLIEEGYEVSVISNFSSNNDQYNFKEIVFENELKGKGCVVYNIPFARSPLNTDNIKAYNNLENLFKNETFDIIHCHTPVGGILTRLAARKYRKKGLKVIYTAHGFHFYKGSSLINWLLYYPIEKICSYFTDVLITINKEDYELAKKKMKAKRVEYIPGVGVDVEKFRNTLVDRDLKRKELGIPKDSKVLLSVGELNKNKNHEVVLRAFANINDKNTHYMIVGKGELHGYLLNLAKELKVEDRFHLLGYRTDVAELYKISDIFCFPSFREGLSVALMEALSSGCWCVVSNIRGNNDLVIDGVNGLLVNEFTSNDLLTIPSTSDSTIIENFDKGVVNKKFRKIYEGV